MIDTYTLKQFETQYTADQIAAKLAAIEQIVFDLQLDINSNEDYENFSKETEIALTKINNALYAAIYNRKLN